MNGFTPRTRWFVWPLTAAVALAACDSATTDVDTTGEAIAFEQGVSFQLTDTAVVVNGTPRARVVDPNRSLTVHHATSFEYGGLGRYQTDELWGEQWFSRFMYDLEPAAQGDTVIIDFLDFGDVTLEGTDTMYKSMELDVSGAPYPIEVQDFVLYGATHYAWRQEENGAEILFVESTYLQRMLDGATMSIASSGSAEVAAFDADFSIQPMPAVEGLDNNGALDFTQERPVIDASHDFGISFDGVVDPEGTVFALVPWSEDAPDQATRRAATVVGGLQSPADRAVIRGSVLTSLLDALGADEARYLLFIVRYETTGYVIQTTRLDTQETLDLQVNLADQTFYMIRLVR